MIQEIMTEGDFNQVLGSTKGPVVVDFFSRACAPCKVLGKMLSSAVEKNTNLTVVKVDIEIVNEIARKFKIRSVPTILIMKDQQVVRQRTGNCSEGQLLELLEA